MSFKKITLDTYRCASWDMMGFGENQSNQGFMQDKIIASHTCFGGHMDVQAVYKLLNVCDDLKWTTNTHVTPLFSLTFKA